MASLCMLYEVFFCQISIHWSILFLRWKFLSCFAQQSHQCVLANPLWRSERFKRFFVNKTVLAWNSLPASAFEGQLQTFKSVASRFYKKKNSQSFLSCSSVNFCIPFLLIFYVLVSPFLENPTELQSSCYLRVVRLVILIVGPSSVCHCCHIFLIIIVTLASDRL